MGQKVLIDTNIAIGYFGNGLSPLLMNQLDNIIGGEFHLSVINKIELLGFPDLEKNEEEKFNLFIDHSVLHQIDYKIIQETIALRKKYKIKLPDAIIAATCLVHDLDFITLNFKDFQNLDGLKIMPI